MKKEINPSKKTGTVKKIEKSGASVNAKKPIKKETGKAAKKVAKPTRTCGKPKKVGKSTKLSKKITKDMMLGEVMALKPKSKEVFMGFGLHCFGCPMSAMETLEEAAQLHGIDLDLMLQKLNEL